MRTQMLISPLLSTASRMESNSQPDRIHASSETAELLRNAGKEAWLSQREDKIVAKGKGLLTTYWVFLDEDLSGRGLAAKSRHMLKSDDSIHGLDASTHAPVDLRDSIDAEKRARLSGWNAELLLRHLKQIVAQREQNGPVALESELSFDGQSKPFEEIVDVLELPSDVATSLAVDVDFDKSVVEELHQFVRVISSMYRENSCKCRRHIVSHLVALSLYSDTSFPPSLPSSQL